ncbi:MAG: polynucleotide adenylyltransferase [Verrucomicrobiales bacterium]|nr:polynucleotide adenylyltransferase [Verrucomicrobiales bacterium]
MIDLPPQLRRVLSTTPALSEAYLVGGCVRDALLGLPVKDVDVEVYGLTLAELEEALRPHGRVDAVGRSFGVLKFSCDGQQHDFSVPRRDSKSGRGHRGFEVQLDPSIPPREASARRDFTLNAMMLHVASGELFDFFGGREDLRARILRHTSEAFTEDPLRVLRGMQFAARFDLTPAPETIDLSRTILSGYAELPVERVREEWMKWALRSVRPSRGLAFLLASGWLDHFPELAAMVGVPQDPEWHPEGDVFTHTCHCLDALVSLPEWIDAPPATRVVLSLATLVHDTGKATRTFTEIRDGRPRITSPGHEGESVRLGSAFLTRIGISPSVVQHVTPLVANHMAHFEEPTDRAVRRLARRLAPANVQHLATLMTADSMGRPPRPCRIPDSVERLLRVASALAVTENAPKPLLRGRHLLRLGMEHGPVVGHWTHLAFEAQLDGAFHTLQEAHQWLSRHPDFPGALRPAAAAFRESPPDEAHATPAHSSAEPAQPA